MGERKKIKDSTKFIFKWRKKYHRTSAEILGCLYGFTESQFPNLPRQEPQSEQRNKEDIVAIKQEQHGNLKKNIQKTTKNKFEW